MIPGVKMNDFPKTVAILGVGLLGTSIGRGLLARGCVEKVVGWGRNAEKLALAKKLDAVTDFTDDLRAAVKDAELVVVCTPVGMIAELVRQAAEFAPAGTLFTDVGSTKTAVSRGLEASPPGNRCRFLGGHPIAGKENHSLEASDGELFSGKVTVLTPTLGTSAEDVGLLTRFWETLGSRVFRMSPEEHDAALARTSHFPHVLACVLAKIVPPELYPLAGTGFGSVSRPASGNVAVWKDILLENADAVLESLEMAASEINILADVLRRRDAETLEEFLEAAKENRDKFI